MRWIFDWIVDFMEENGSIDHKYRDVYVYAVQTVFVYISQTSHLNKRKCTLKIQ